MGTACDEPYQGQHSHLIIEVMRKEFTNLSWPAQVVNQNNMAACLVSSTTGLVLLQTKQHFRDFSASKQFFPEM